MVTSAAAQQDGKKPPKPHGRPSCKPDVGLDPQTFRDVISRSLSAFVGSRNGGLPGRFVGVDLRDATASATHTVSGSGGSILAINVNGGATEGVMSMLDGHRLSPRIGVSGTWHGIRNKRSADYETSSCRRLDDAIVRAEQALALRRGDIESGAASIQRRSDRANLAQRARMLDSLISTLGAPATDAGRLRRDSLQMELRRTKTRLIWLDSVPLPDELSEQNDAFLAAEKAYADARAQLDIRGVSLGWWSVGVAAQNIRFDLYDGTLPSARQLSPHSVYHRSALVSYTRLRHSSFSRESYYASVAVRAGWESSFGELTRRELIDRTQLTPPPLERYTERKRTVYQGTLDTEVSTVRITADYYDFVSRAIAVHLFPGLAARSGRPTEVSSGIGIMLSSRKPDMPASTSNLELFYDIPDLTNSRSADGKFWKRGQVGLRLAFPLGVPKGG